METGKTEVKRQPCFKNSDEELLLIREGPKKQTPLRGAKRASQGKQVWITVEQDRRRLTAFISGQNQCGYCIWYMQNPLIFSTMPIVCLRLQFLHSLTYNVGKNILSGRHVYTFNPTMSKNLSKLLYPCTRFQL